MPRTIDILLTALAPSVWGSAYIVTTELLPAGYPLSVAVLRGLDGSHGPCRHRPPASLKCHRGLTAANGLVLGRSRSDFRMRR
jgi:hypothetical protein